MSALSGIGHAVGDGPNLVLQLKGVADDAARAAQFAKGEYIPQVSRKQELTTAFNSAGEAATALDGITPLIAMLDGGEDGLRLAKEAIMQLENGREALRTGVVIEDDVVRSGTVVADARAIGTAVEQFAAAAGKVHDVAAIATIETTSVDDLLRAIVGHG